MCCAGVALRAERDVLRGGSRAHGVDIRLRVAALLSDAPPPDVAAGRTERTER